MTTYRTTGAWGAGIGRNLTPAEVDANFYEIRADVQELVENPPGAVTVTNVSATGSQVTFFFSDESFFTVTVPTATTPVPAPVITRTGSTLTPAIGDANRYIRLTNAGGCTVSIPLNSSIGFPIGTELHFRQAGGPIGFFGVTGVTINTPEGFSPATEREHATVTIKQVATDVWDLFGLLAVDESASA